MGNADVGTQDVALLELFDRILDGGIVLSGDPTTSLTDVDFIPLGLKAILTWIYRTESKRWGEEGLQLGGGSQSIADCSFVHAIMDAGIALPPDLAGLVGGPLSAVSWHGLSAVTSRLDLATLNDPTPDHFLCHNTLVEALAAKGPVLPVRFGTVFADEIAVRRAVVERYTTLTSDLARLRGKIEMGVSVVWNPAGQNDDEPQDTAGASRDWFIPGRGPGVSYIEGRRAKYRREEVARSRAATVAQALHGILRPSALDSRYVILPRPHVLLRAAYLLDRSRVGAFHEAFELVEDQDPCLCMLPSGPWPPYSFVTRPNGPAATVTEVAGTLPQAAAPAGGASEKE